MLVLNPGIRTKFRTMRCWLTDELSAVLVFSRAGRRATVLRGETVLVQANVKDKGQEDGKGREDDTLKYPRVCNSKGQIDKGIRNMEDPP